MPRASCRGKSVSLRSELTVGKEEILPPRRTLGLRRRPGVLSQHLRHVAYVWRSLRWLWPGSPSGTAARSQARTAVVPRHLDGVDVAPLWSNEEKLELVAEACQPGNPVSQVSRERAISASQLFGWRRKAIAQGLITDRCLEELPAKRTSLNGTLRAAKARLLMGLTRATFVFALALSSFFLISQTRVSENRHAQA